MKGRDLILYILANGLENEPVFENGRLLGFMTLGEAATKFEVGPATVRVWVNEGMLYGIKMGEEIYIPADSEKPVPLSIPKIEIGKLIGF